ncbi:RidA family protein [uncultured Roseovarius sp.]|uniref:RidA family protein n=1 Tax=uncultured Roseovarius sp. TaxID=293344 RepID=UPI0026192427|nr:RidA family protein [uncultured Roseovarius sp.]
MKRRYSWPEGHWNWPVNLTHQHGVRAGQMIFTGGQVDLDAEGVVRNPGDIHPQCDAAMQYLSDVLTDLGVGVEDLVRLVVYFVGDAATEARLLDQLAGILAGRAQPVVNLIALPELCYPEMMIEIEGVAMRGEDDRPVPRQCLHLPDMPALSKAFSHLVVCGDMIFTGDISAVACDGRVEAAGDVVRQTEIMMDQLSRALSSAGADMGDVVKLNVFYVGAGSAEDWEEPAKIRAGYFPDPGPAPTGMPVPYFPNPEVMTKIYVTAMKGEKTHAWPVGHWDWTTPLPYKHGNKCGQVIHVGGQVSLDSAANVVDPGNMVAQTRRAMANVEKVLADLGAGLDDVVKVTTFYQGNASAEALHENLLIRSNSYTAPGPATTGIPMPALVYRNMVIEIEVTAILDA